MKLIWTPVTEEMTLSSAAETALGWYIFTSTQVIKTPF